MYTKIDKATEYLRTIIKMRPHMVIVCNTGLENIENMMSLAIDIPFSDIEGFKESTIEESKLVYGILEDKYVLLVYGKPAFFEGISKEDYAFMFRVFANLGIKMALLTTSCGSINNKIKTNDEIIITDHISLFAPNLLVGPNYDRFGPRLIDCSNIYNKTLVELILNEINKEEEILKPANIVFLSGPNYETPSEVKALKALGADTISLSLVPEATLCHQMGMSVIGIGFVTNMASGINKRPLSYREIATSARYNKEERCAIIKKIVKILPKE